MPVMSAFQRLPLHIAESIIKYYVSPFQTSSEIEWLTLYNISYSWRILALQQFYQTASIVVSSDTGKDKLEFPNKPCQVEEYTTLLGYVNEVKVVFQPEDRAVYVLEHNDFSHTWPKILKFPTARFLRIDVAGFLNHYERLNGTPATTEFMWLAQCIRSSMPNLQNVTIIDSKRRADFHDHSYTRTQWNAGNLLSAIFERVANVSFRARELCPENIRQFASNCPKLVQLEFDCVHNIELLHHVARGSAGTLRMLCIRYYPLRTVKSIVVDDEDQPVVYPQLQTLRFYSSPKRNSPGITIKIDQSVAIFPALRSLTWLSKYTFDDDVLFRGNSGTLEHLDIAFGEDLVNVLERHNVFTTGRFPRLGHVKIHGNNYNTRSESGKELYLRHAARLLSPATRILSISNTGSYQEINGAAFKVVCLQNIRALDIDSIDIRFFEMRELIKRLPCLTRLKTASSSMHSGLEYGIGPINTLIKDAYKELYPLNVCFRVWSQDFGRHESMSPFALACVVLAAVCPAFVYACVPYHVRDAYLQELKAAISSIPDGQYSKALEDLYRRSEEYWE